MLNGFVGAVVGGFEPAVGLVPGVGAVVEPAFGVGNVKNNDPSLTEPIAGIV